MLSTAETISMFFAGQQAAKKVVDDVVDGDAVQGTSHTGGAIQKPATNNESACDYRARVLVHIFSNSGGINLEALCIAYRDQLHTPTSALPANAIFFDSTPGGPFCWRELPRWTRGFNVNLATVSPIPTFVSLKFSCLLVVFIFGAPLLFGQETLPVRIMKFLNNLENISNDSKADILIGWRDVEEDAAKAKSRGFDMQLERFEESSHAGHMSVEKYWVAIRQVWEGASA